MITLCRVDDRLIHGQVVTAWVKVLGTEQIIVLDKETANDKMQQSILKMSAPPNIKVHCFSIEQFLKITETNPITKNTMLLFKTSEELVKLVRSGYELTEINIGGMRKNDSRKQYTKSLSLSEDERKAFEEIMQKGINVYVQLVPKDQKMNLKEVIK